MTVRWLRSVLAILSVSGALTWEYLQSERKDGHRWMSHMNKCRQIVPSGDTGPCGGNTQFIVVVRCHFTPNKTLSRHTTQCLYGGQLINFPKKSTKPKPEVCSQFSDEFRRYRPDGKMRTKGLARKDWKLYPLIVSSCRKKCVSNSRCKIYSTFSISCGLFFFGERKMESLFQKTRSGKIFIRICSDYQH